MIPLMVYSIGMEKKLGREKKKCFLDYIKSSELPNLQLFHVFHGGKNKIKSMKFLRKNMFSVMPEIFQ